MVDENGSAKKVGKCKTNIVKILAIILFLVNGYDFIKMNGNYHPLLFRLFNRVIFLSILIFVT